MLIWQLAGALLLSELGWICVVGVTLEILLLICWAWAWVACNYDPRYASTPTRITEAPLPNYLRKTWETFIIEETPSSETSVPDVCAICLCAYTQGDVVKRLDCGHKFHDACIDTWLVPHMPGRRCPMR